MKVATTIAFGAGLLVMALSPAAASAQQQAYAPAEHHDDRAETRDYGAAASDSRYGQRYAGRDGAQAYGERRDEQRGLSEGQRRYADGRAYDGDRSYGRRDGVEAGHDDRYRSDGYRNDGYRGDAYRGDGDRDRGNRDGDYSYRRSGDGYAYGGGYPDYAYDRARGYEGAPYDNRGYDEYSGFVAPPVYGEDYGQPYYGRSSGRCGCGY